MSFGENLISLRESKGISRQELANLLGIPYTTLRNYETDQREPGHKVLIKIARIFHVSVDSLIGNIENAPAPAEPETEERDDSRAESFFKQLIAAGYLGEGEDFTAAQVEVLQGVLKILNATFPRRKTPDGNKTRKVG